MRLQLKDVNVILRKKAVLKEITVSMTQGVYGVIGENGAGKTTLFRTILGLQKYTGEVVLENIKKTGYVPQKFDCLQGLNLEETLYYFCCLKNMKRELRKDYVEHALQIVNLTKEKEKKVKELSGGMLRRLGIAQAVIDQPELLIMDEPTVGLDPMERMNFRKIIEQIKSGRIILISSHEIREVENICEKILFLHQGRMFCCESVSCLREHYGTDDLEKIYFEIVTERQ